MNLIQIDLSLIDLICNQFLLFQKFWKKINIILKM